MCRETYMERSNICDICYQLCEMCLNNKHFIETRSLPTVSEIVRRVQRTRRVRGSNHAPYHAYPSVRPLKPLFPTRGFEKEVGKKRGSPKGSPELCDGQKRRHHAYYGSPYDGEPERHGDRDRVGGKVDEPSPPIYHRPLGQHLKDHSAERN